jgi:hypothetical protein
MRLLLDFNKVFVELCEKVQSTWEKLATHQPHDPAIQQWKTYVGEHIQALKTHIFECRQQDPAYVAAVHALIAQTEECRKENPAYVSPTSPDDEVSGTETNLPMQNFWENTEKLEKELKAKDDEVLLKLPLLVSLGLPHIWNMYSAESKEKIWTLINNLRIRAEQIKGCDTQGPEIEKIAQGVVQRVLDSGTDFERDGIFTSVASIVADVATPETIQEIYGAVEHFSPEGIERASAQAAKNLSMKTDVSSQEMQDMLVLPHDSVLKRVQPTSSIEKGTMDNVMTADELKGSMLANLMPDLGALGVSKSQQEAMQRQVIAGMARKWDVPLEQLEAQMKANDHQAMNHAVTVSAASVDAVGVLSQPMPQSMSQVERLGMAEQGTVLAQAALQSPMMQHEIQQLQIHHQQQQPHQHQQYQQPSHNHNHQTMSLFSTPPAGAQGLSFLTQPQPVTSKVIAPNTTLAPVISFASRQAPIQMTTQNAPKNLHQMLLSNVRQTISAQKGGSGGDVSQEELLNALQSLLLEAKSQPIGWVDTPPSFSSQPQPQMQVIQTPQQQPVTTMPQQMSFLSSPPVQSPAPPPQQMQLQTQPTSLFQLPVAASQMPGLIPQSQELLQQTQAKPRVTFDSQMKLPITAVSTSSS